MGYLFDEAPRRYVGPADYAEGSLSYYSRSGRPEVARLRELLESWLASYPVDCRDGLISRMRKDFEPFRAAFFELFVYQLLVATGHEVEIHPPVQGTDRRPDFLAAPKGGGGPVFVEAISVRAEGASARADRKVHDRVQDDINRFRHPDFFVHLVRLKGRPRRY